MKLGMIYAHISNLLKLIADLSLRLRVALRLHWFLGMITNCIARAQYYIYI